MPNNRLWKHEIEPLENWFISSIMMLVPMFAESKQRVNSQHAWAASAMNANVMKHSSSSSSSTLCAHLDSFFPSRNIIAQSAVAINGRIF